MERCLERVAAYRASGQKSRVWAQANGVPARVLASWCAHSRRWQARLDGVSAGPSVAPGRAVSWPPGWRRVLRRHQSWLLEHTREAQRFLSLFASDGG